MAKHASARPTKRFFIQMLTADIALEDALLDLVDNAVDAIVQRHQLPLDMRLITDDKPAKPKGRIDLTVSDDIVRVVDNGLGIAEKDAIHDVFRLGKVSLTHGPTLGAYGIGLKRALFKIGNSFEVASRVRNENGFKAGLDDVETWAEYDPENPKAGEDPWEIPLVTQGSSANREVGTEVIIKHIRPEILMRLRDATLTAHIRARIGETYSLLLNRYIQVFLNKRPVEPADIPIGSSKDLRRAIKHVHGIEGGRVKAAIVAGVADQDGQSTETAGWYVLCNGRAIVVADKTKMTGWGVDGFPIYVQSFLAFIGIVFFFSDLPQLLPWQTTKIGLNPDSPAYLSVKSTMQAIAKPVLSYLRSLYYSNDEQTTEQRALLGKVKRLRLTTIGLEADEAFHAPMTPSKKKKDSVRVQYDATHDEIRRGAKSIGDPRASATRVGRAALDFLLEQGAE